MAKYFPKEFREVKENMKDYLPELSNVEVGVESAALVYALVSREILSFEKPHDAERQDDIRHFMMCYFDIRMKVILDERNFERVFTKIVDMAYLSYRREPIRPRNSQPM